MPRLVKETNTNIIREYIQKNPVFGWLGNTNYSAILTNTLFVSSGGVVGTPYANLVVGYEVAEATLSNNNRVIGYVEGYDSEGNERVVLLSNDNVIQTTTRKISRTVDIGILQEFEFKDDSYRTKIASPTPVGINSGGFPNEPGGYMNMFEGAGADVGQYANFTEQANMDWKQASNYFAPFQSYCTYKRNDIPSGVFTFTLSNDVNNTLVIAQGKQEEELRMFTEDYLPEGIIYFNGDVFGHWTTIFGAVAAGSSMLDVSLYRDRLCIPGLGIKTSGTTSRYTKIYNIPLTEDLTQAREYLNSGNLPTDAYIYPFDSDNPPVNDGSGGDSGDTDGDITGETDDSSIDGESTPITIPSITPMMLSSNNYYWLSYADLNRFFNWFWTDAGNILEVGDLLGKLEGLYNDLSSAIVSLKYYPAYIDKIGGYTEQNTIIVGNIEMPFNGVKVLNKNIKSLPFTVGTVTIPHKYSTFCDYSPYSSLHLYLPFNGWIDLDIDIFMGRTLEVKMSYDVLSGTIQYYIYCIDGSDEYLVNTLLCDMSVNIPFNLQSKNDTQNTILSNVTSVASSIVGAGASAVTGNPIGLIMSSGGLINSSSNAIPFKVFGSQGQTGAFFAPNRCAYYIKAPTYNKPKNYGKEVGYPTNKQITLGSTTGLIIVYNPRITFSSYPLDSEIEEIYRLLERGVIV